MNTYKELTLKFIHAQDKYMELMNKHLEKHMKSVELDGLIQELKTLPLKLKFDNRLFNMTIQKVVVNHDNTIDFHFKNGVVVKLDLQETLA